MDHGRITDVARAQHGLITFRQVAELGGSPQQIRTLVGSGAWLRARRGIYVVGAAPDTWERRVMAACLAAGPDAVAGLRSAARLWDLVPAAGRIQLLVGDDRRVRLDGVEVRRSALLPPMDRAIARGVPVTSAARTLVDLSPTQPDETLGVWVDTLLRAGRLHLLDLQSCVARLAGPGRPSIDAIRSVLALRLPGYDPGDSNLEVRALRALGDAGLPLPVQQHLVVGPDGRPSFLDLAYPEHLVGIELDGWTFHNQRSDFDRDRRRRNALTLLGWRIYQFTSTTTDLTLVTTIRRALGLDDGDPSQSGQKLLLSNRY